MKAGKEHRIPLGKRTLEILTTIRPFSGKEVHLHHRQEGRSHVHHGDGHALAPNGSH